VRIPVGYSRMMKGGDMGHILLCSFILGIGMDILRIL
jgi:hypothetical protein